MEKIPYLEWLKEELLGLSREGQIVYKRVFDNDLKPKERFILWLSKRVLAKNLHLARPSRVRRHHRTEGRDWPARAYTMIGLKRLNNIEFCLRRVLEEKIPGDVIETGVWKGGAVILMRAVLSAYGDRDRKVWVADSFAGLPKPRPKQYPQDAEDRHYTLKELAIDLETVKQHFKSFHLLDDQVKFLKGWFKDTLPQAPIDQLAVLRLDGDMYESTMDALIHLYPKLQSGGYCIVDDWGAIPACKAAVEDYRKQHGITEDIHTIDWTGVFWRKA